MGEDSAEGSTSRLTASYEDVAKHRVPAVAASEVSGKTEANTAANKTLSRMTRLQCIGGRLAAKNNTHGFLTPAATGLVSLS